jgi:hypothetical protein
LKGLIGAVSPVLPITTPNMAEADDVALSYFSILTPVHDLVVSGA